jgi:hypothetical protein
MRKVTALAVATSVGLVVAAQVVTAITLAAEGKTNLKSQKGKPIFPVQPYHDPKGAGQKAGYQFQFPAPGPQWKRAKPVAEPRSVPLHTQAKPSYSR